MSVLYEAWEMKQTAARERSERVRFESIQLVVRSNCSNCDPLIIDVFPVTEGTYASDVTTQGSAPERRLGVGDDASREFAALNFHMNCNLSLRLVQ